MLGKFILEKKSKTKTPKILENSQKLRKTRRNENEFRKNFRFLARTRHRCYLDEISKRTEEVKMKTKTLKSDTENRREFSLLLEAMDLKKWRKLRRKVKVSLQGKITVLLDFV